MARVLADDWRPLMEAVRQCARAEADAGRVWIMQKGERVDPHSFKGPIRLSLPRDGIR